MTRLIRSGSVLLSALFLALTITPTKAQEPEIKWSVPLTNEDKDVKMSIIHADETGTYLLKEWGPISDKHVVLRKMDQELSTRYSVDIPASIGVFGDNLLFSKILPVKNGFLVFYNGWKKETKTGFLEVRKINDKGQLEEKGIILDSEMAQNQLKKADHYVTISDDMTKLLVLSELPFEKKMNNKIRIKVFNAETLTEIGKKEHTFANDMARHPFHKIAVNNKGQSFIYKQIHQGKGIYDQFLYIFDPSDKEFAEKKLDLQGKHLNDFRLLINSKQELIISGLYAGVATATPDLEGHFVITADPVSKNISVELSPYSADLLEFADRKGKTSLINYDLKDVILTEDNKILILSEYIKTESTPVTGSSPIAYTYTYQTGNIIVATLDASGKLVKTKVIGKNQNTTYTGPESLRKYDSFLFTYANGKLSIIYNNITLNSSLIDGVPAWRDNSGNVRTKTKEFGPYAVYAPFIHVVKADDPIPNDKSPGTPFTSAFKTLDLPVALNGHVYRSQNGDLYFIAEMTNGSKFRIGRIQAAQ